MNRLLNNTDKNNMLDGILDWLNSNVSRFQTPLEETIEDITPENIKADTSRKAFVELGLALRLAQRSPFLKGHSQIKRLKESWISILESRNFFFDTRRRIQLIPHRAVSYSVLKSFGINKREVFEDLQNVLDRNYMDRVERSAWDKLDMKYYIEACGLKHNFPSNKELLISSSLLNLPNLSYVQNMDLYGLTHLLFHFSDFGAINMKRFLGSGYQSIQDYVNIVLSMSVIKQDWDLTAELLINQYCLRKQFSTIDKEAAKRLYETLQPSGFIPGRDWVNTRKKDLSNQDVGFNDVYHPTIVSLILLVCEFTDY